MSLIHRLFSRQPRAGELPFTDSRRDASRRDLLAQAVRETLHKHGIPASWIQAEASPVLRRQNVRAIQLRLVARHWHPALASCVVALQGSVLRRLEQLDADCSDWLVGVCWKFEPEDDSACPTLPSPDFWHDEPARPTPATRPPVSAALWRLLAEGDRAFAGRAVDAFKPTQPMSYS